MSSILKGSIFRSVPFRSVMSSQPCPRASGQNVTRRLPRATHSRSQLEDVITQMNNLFVQLHHFENSEE